MSAIVSNSLTIAILSSAIVFVASLVTGLCGFGFALVAVPFMLFIMDPKTVVPTVTIVSLVLDAMILYEARLSVEWRKIRHLMAAGVVGMLIGTLMLLYFDFGALKFFFGLTIVLFAAASFAGFRRQIRSERLAYVIVGFLGGLLGGSTSIAGPPVVLFFSNQGASKETFRANLIAFLLSMYVVTIPSYALSGLITMDLVGSTLTLVPALVIGALSGIKLSYRVE